MAKTKTRSRAAAGKTADKTAAPARARAKAPAKSALMQKTAHARRAPQTVRPARAANSRTPVAPVHPAAHVAVPVAAQPSPLAATLAPALRRIARYKRSIARRARRQSALLRLSARRTLRQLRTSIAATGRSAFVSARRRLRYANDSLNRKAERKLEDAQRVMHRTFRPVMRRVMPYRRAAIAGGVAAFIITLVSIGWMSLFDQATAVPSPELIATVQRMSSLKAAPSAGEKPLLANIDPAPTPAPAPAAPDLDIAPTPAPAVVTAPPQVQAPPPAPVVRTPTPAKAERPADEKHRAREARSSHQRIPAEARNAMASVGSGGESGAGSGFAGSSLIAEARRYLGTNPTGRSSLWCGAFMDLILRKTGHKGGGNLALGYEHYGTRVAGPEIGAIAVMGRRGGGHVGVVSGIDAHGNPIIVSGNHNHTVAEAVYPRGRIITYVMPN